jgi:hypothetical protein
MKRTLLVIATLGLVATPASAEPVKHYFYPPPPVVEPVVEPVVVQPVVVQPVVRPVVQPIVRPVVVDPYAHRVVIAGGGFGGLLLRASDSTSLVPSYRLDLGLALGRSSVGLRANLAPGAMTLPDVDGKQNALDLYALRLTFDHRFLRNAAIHPVAGAGLEALIGKPTIGDTGVALAATARAGMEFAYPFGQSTLAVGLDATFHLPFAQTDTMAADLDAMLSFGAYATVRF